LSPGDFDRDAGSLGYAAMVMAVIGPDILDEPRILDECEGSITEKRPI